MRRGLLVLGAAVLAGCTGFDASVEAGDASTVEGAASAEAAPHGQQPDHEVTIEAVARDQAVARSHVRSLDGSLYEVSVPAPPVDLDGLGSDEDDVLAGVQDASVFCAWLVDSTLDVLAAIEGLDRATPVRNEQAVDAVLAATLPGYQDVDRDAVSAVDIAKGCGLGIEREWVSPLAVPLVVHRLTDFVDGQLAWYAAPDGYEGDTTAYMAEAFYERAGDELVDLCEWVVPEAQAAIDAGLVSSTVTEQASHVVDLILTDAVAKSADGLTALIVGACDTPGASSPSSVEFGEALRALAPA